MNTAKEMFIDEQGIAKSTITLDIQQKEQIVHKDDVDFYGSKTELHGKLYMGTDSNHMHAELID